ncbi:MAG: hypothetical protein R3292_12485 [Alcanivorax sp.]|nr:hypothetical protein [Alcanivorax sp.]
MNKDMLKIFRPIAIAVALLPAGVPISALAAAPSISIAQLDRQEGHDPTHMAKGIPRDFPLPASSHHLVANTTLSLGTVQGVDATIAEHFYHHYFKQAGWDVLKQAKAPGFIMLTACQKSGEQCVRLSASSPGGMTSTPNQLRFTFPTRSDLKR